MTVEQAIKVLDEKGLKISADKRTSTSETIEAGKVVKTSPGSGRTVKKGSSVILYESVGLGAYVMEDFTGKNYVEVKTILEKINNLFVLKEVIAVDDATNVSADQIIKQSPEAGTKLKEGDTVTLYVPDMTATYPDFTTGEYSLSDIQAFCDKYGLTLKEEYVQDDTYEVGSIISQNKAAGSEIITGMTLKIVIAEEVDTTADEG